ncbi:MAG: inorganic phosphate transporter [Elusimicrobia bacterium GWC2_51_8]|nr:MAG: inorganic phosphate transporter [Elusimicrobia bacterium GWA2_51_34]OGR57529.1 MAG: inorganic phosphate transporter [Elusimicrobia bacterium GWC2_51_8]OGR87788.1 MAG: inorganic phosphate transporter [Elusimicrobia bacterium GWF2_52_66]HAF96537.1 anion permease [Elusimicrobiota bacterium]HCE97615.1 anion permease [Elusimicrobiota bacterium]
MDSTLLAVIGLVTLALVFDFLNGFHDAANSIATIVSTRVLSPRQAVIWAAFFNVVAFFIFNHAVAKTMGKGIIDVNIIDAHIIFGALMGACAWNILTWYYGLPSSSSHALMGGLAGAAVVKAGTGVLVMSGIIKVLLFIVISPVLGMLLGLLFGVVVYRLFSRAIPGKVDHLFRKGQLISAAAYSLGHGGNDAQKTMGVITGLLFSAGYLGGKFEVPGWVALACYSAMGLGTMSGGWRIVKTMGHKISKLKPVDGFCAESGAAATLFLASSMGVPVSTTHTITGAIMGVGTMKRFSAVKWGVAGQIVWAWVLTIPGAALISALVYWLSVHLLS